MNRLQDNDLEDKQQIWELYGYLADYYFDQIFSAEQVAYDTNTPKKLVNKILHRLIHHKAVTCVGTDNWGVKSYRINDDFEG